MRNNPTVCYLYVLGCEDGPCKIGYAAEPEDRVKAMTREGRKGVFVIGSFEVDYWKARAAERYAHWLVRDHHLEREWSNIPHEVALDAVRQATSPRIVEQLDSHHLIPAVVVPAPKIKNGENIVTKFPQGTRKRLHEAAGERGHSAFVRDAVAAALDAHEAAKRKPDA